MAHFYGRLKPGDKSETTRCGTKDDGLTASASGWQVGGEVQMYEFDRHDVAELYVTTGSSPKGGKKLIARAVYHHDTGELTVVVEKGPVTL